MPGHTYLWLCDWRDAQNAKDAKDAGHTGHVWAMEMKDAVGNASAAPFAAALSLLIACMYVCM